MSKARVLFVSQALSPFLPESNIANISRYLPQAIHEKGKEIRIFMPRFGKINERRHQLHEVIRLSGMNMVINDSDHPLIIKVASIPSARIQVYFIDNEEYFKRKSLLADDEGQSFSDNDERSIFFVRGVLETVKKLGWSPDIIHCHGWMTALLPAYVKKIYNKDPHFSSTKVVYSPYDDVFSGTLDTNVSRKLTMDGFKKDDVHLLEHPNHSNVIKMGVNYSDGVICGPEELSDDVNAFIKSSARPVLRYSNPESCVSEVDQFFDAVLENKGALIEG
jgi:starch synthase